MEPALYIVATPIGNLGDVSRRAVEILAGADVVAAEDTRRTAQLLSHEGIHSRLQSYHEHSPASATQSLVARIIGGGSVALVSDAGTPTISDPGYRLVRAVQEAGGRVVPIPGACAAVAALSAAGLPSDRFSFEGFLPARREPRRKRLASLAAEERTQIFYEAPHRLEETLDDMEESFGPMREVALARELTKNFETIRRLPLFELRQWVAGDQNQTRGELVLLVAPAEGEASTDIDPALGELLSAMAEHMPPREAAALVASYSGVRKKQLYQYLLERRDN